MITFIKTILLVITFILNTFFSPVFGNFTAKTQPVTDDCKLFFASISDIHMTDDALRSMMLEFGLSDMENFDHTLDVLVCSGDLTDHGEKEEWDNLEKTFSKYNPAENIILAQGNHDTWTEDDKYDLAKKYFIEYNEKISDRKIEHEYYSTEINGYSFIVLGSETDRTSAYISEEQLEWLDAEMDKASKDGLPIFVISHWPINQTHGLPETWGDDEPEPDDGGLGDQSADVEKILKKYKNVFMISGHLHNGVTNENQVDVYTYVSVESDGSFHSINLPPYMYATIRGRVSNGTGLNFEVYDNRVDIRTRSYSAGVWYTDYNYSIPLV